VEYGLSFPYDFMTEWTYGIRLGEIHTFGAGTGAGKTDLFTEIAYHLMHEHEESVAMFMFEQEPQETAIRLCGKAGDKRFHIPNNPEVPTDNDWTTEELEGAFDKLQHDRHVFLYDSFGANDWDDVQETIRFLRHSEGVRYFFIDHITALSEWKTDTRAELEKMMAEMAGLVKEINSTIFLVSHLATPEGKSHEEGGRVTVRHYKGSRAIGTYSHFIWALERDQQAESEDIRHTSTVRCLKDRYTGNGTGKTSLLKYNQQTGRLFEKPKDMAAGVDFEDETADAENTTEKGDDF
jgi:twinkle protein